jgi:hypothetical protein
MLRVDPLHTPGHPTPFTVVPKRPSRIGLLAACRPRPHSDPLAIAHDDCDMTSYSSPQVFPGDTSTIVEAAGPSADGRTNAALSEYQSAMGQHPDTRRFATQFDNCHSPEAVSKIFRTQAEAFDRFSKGDEKLMKWLNLIVQVLFTFSTTPEEQIREVRPSHSLH